MIPHLPMTREEMPVQVNFSSISASELTQRTRELALRLNNGKY